RAWGGERGPGAGDRLLEGLDRGADGLRPASPLGIGRVGDRGGAPHPRRFGGRRRPRGVAPVECSSNRRKLTLRRNRQAGGDMPTLIRPIAEGSAGKASRIGVGAFDDGEVVTALRN